MKLRLILILAALGLPFAAPAGVRILGHVREIIHIPRHRPIEGARVMIRARLSAGPQTTQTDANRAFELGWAAGSMPYGSGFLDGNSPPPHAFPYEF